MKKIDINNETYSHQYFEQYKLYLQSIEKISDRRGEANKYFITINTGIISVFALLVSPINNKIIQPVSLSLILILGIIISIIFWFLINSYKQLNTGKFKLIHDIEKKLPLKLYSEEWKNLSEGKDKNIYLPFSHVEKIVPIIFGTMYSISLVILIHAIFCK